MTVRRPLLLLTVLVVEMIFSSCFANSFATNFREGKDTSLLQIKMLQMDPSTVNFSFADFKTQWFTSQDSWDQFWVENSRIVDPKAPENPVDWSKQAVLAIFWPSKDAVIRMPAFQSSEQLTGDAQYQNTKIEIPQLRNSSQPKKDKTLRLHLLLNTPCFGIITDASPTQFLVFDYKNLDFASIDVQTKETKETSCIPPPTNQGGSK